MVLLVPVILYRQMTGSTPIDWRDSSAQIERIWLFTLVVGTAFIGNVAQHAATTAISWGFLLWMGWLKPKPSDLTAGVQSMREPSVQALEHRLRDHLHRQAGAQGGTMAEVMNDGRRREFRRVCRPDRAFDMTTNGSRHVAYTRIGSQ